MHTGIRFKGTLLSSIVISTLAVSAMPALAADDRFDGSAEVTAALQRDLGLAEAQIKELGPQQERAVKLDRELQDSLGAAFAGSQFDLRSGRLIVMVSDEGALDKAKASGADARLVKHSLRELDAIQAELDAQAGGPKGDARETAKPQSTPFTSFSVDPLSNTVQVTTTRALATVAKKALAKYGDAVSLEVSEVQPEPAAWMDGGDGINGNSCSAGFNLRNFGTGQKYLLTAGHCVNAGSTLKGQGGVNFGPVLESWFPSFDDALARNTNTGYWIQGPWVDTNPSNGGIVTTSGHTDLPPGFPICKSGIKTKWTCGIITAKNQTVTYTGGLTVHGLTRHNACVEPGDSGGSNVSILGGFHAEGVTSGASMIVDSEGKKRCRAKFGLSNISWYFPIADSLAYYGPKYGITTW
jgi:streptogrisin C